jgi:N-acetylated-alpha-linked acidic dipeptidase
LNESFVDPTVEATILAEVSLAEPWALIERYATLVRESGSEDERIAARTLTDRLSAFGVPHQTLEADIFISIPKRAGLTMHTAAGERMFAASTPAMSISTGPRGRRGAAVHVPTSYAKSTLTVFDANASARDVDVSGLIVVTEGFANPGKIREMQLRGALGVVCINAGEWRHEGICTPIWGAPDLDDHDRIPNIPVVVIARPDGDALIAALAAGRVELTLETELDTGWKRCPLIVADVRASGPEADDFVLLHGHIDSWFVGIGDNATGNATMLEIARVLQRHRHALRRSVRIAWWPGHSTGRYAGSTWYADRFALELDEHCVVHVNCDSPGCRDATTYENVMWMSECEALAASAVRDGAGLTVTGTRPFRAGDISFNNLGISTFFMLSSEIPEVELRRRGYYPVGGCGMNIEWHTPHDTLDVADRDLLARDLRVYLLGVLRAATAPRLPLDFRATVAEIRAVVERYAAAAGDAVDLQGVLAAADELAAALDPLYTRDLADPRAVDVALRRIGRMLVAVNFTRRGKFKQDPALQGGAVPDLAAAQDLATTVDPHLRNVTLTHLVRGRNRVIHDLREAARIARALASA